MVAEDASGKELAIFLKVGRPATGMPAFNSFSDSDAMDIATFIRSSARAASGRGGGDPTAVIVGDAKAGAVLFNGEGKCATCHSVDGDLKGIGSKYSPPTLQGRIILPRGNGGYPGLSFGGEAAVPPDMPKKVTVTLPSGETVSGTLVSISDYYVTLRDASDTWKTFDRDDKTKVQIKDPLQAHLDLMHTLTDKEMHDLTAYLVTLK
jgi:small nuclear ribonucleoprotein (snRNP)-like protein